MSAISKGMELSFRGLCARIEQPCADSFDDADPGDWYLVCGTDSYYSVWTVCANGSPFRIFARITYRDMFFAGVILTTYNENMQ